MKPARNLPIPAVVAFAVVLAGAIGIWQGLHQGPPAKVEREAPPAAPANPPAVDPAQVTSARPPPERSIGVLGGLVVGPDGAPVPQAQVRMEPSSWVGKPSPRPVPPPAPIQLVTDEAGRFQSQVSMSWSWIVHAKKDALAAVRVDVVPPDANVKLVLTGSQPVEVLVREDQGAGLSGLPVTLTAEGQGANAFEGKTDQKGLARFEQVPLGRWRADAVDVVTAMGSDHKPMWRERRRAQAMFVVDASRPEQVVLTLARTGTIRGRVVAPVGTDLTTLVVFAVPQSIALSMQSQEFGALKLLLPRSYPYAQVTPEGRFEIADVAGPMGLLVPHATLIHDPTPAVAGGADAVITLFKDKTVKGQVVDAAGKPVTHFEVNGAEYASEAGLFEYRPGGRPGAARPKHLMVVVTAAGFFPLEKEVDLHDGDNDLGPLRLEAGRTFILTLVDAKDSKPIEDATFVREGGNALTTEPAEGVSPGVYRFRRLPPEPVTLSVTRYGGGNRKVSIGPADTELTYKFGAGATLRGKVLGPTGQPAVGARVFPSGELQATRLTDSGGQFVFPGLEPGKLTLVVMFGRSSAIKLVEVPEAGEVELDVALSAVP